MARQRVQRSIAIVRPRDRFGLVVVRLSLGKDVAHYVVRAIRCNIGGRGFEMHRLGLGTLYHVRVGQNRECSCECLGFLRHGRCKHVLGLLALVKQKAL